MKRLVSLLIVAAVLLGICGVAMAENRGIDPTARMVRK